MNLEPTRPDNMPMVLAHVNGIEECIEIPQVTKSVNSREEELAARIKNGTWDAVIAEKLKREHQHKESRYLRSRRAKAVTARYIEELTIEVFLAQKNDTKEILTIKRILKASFFKTNTEPELSDVTQERDLMVDSQSKNLKWMTKLKYSFQDTKYLYLAMEYHCGGDFGGLLDSMVQLPLPPARFYFAEMIAATEEIHALGFIHRDLKPGNFVMDKHGHVKLIDFGLSKEGKITDQAEFRNTLLLAREKRLQRQNNYRNSTRLKQKTTIKGAGSPEYMAVEVLDGEEADFPVDVWSLGCILLELLTGYVLFGGNTIEEVFSKILAYEEVLMGQELRSDPHVPQEAWDLLSQIFVRPEYRITIPEIKKHPFFNGLDWNTLDRQTPFFKPDIENEFDTSYFPNARPVDGIELEDSKLDDREDDDEGPSSPAPASPGLSRRKLRGFTFKRPPSFFDHSGSIGSMLQASLAAEESRTQKEIEWEEEILRWCKKKWAQLEQEASAAECAVCHRSLNGKSYTCSECRCVVCSTCGIKLRSEARGWTEARVFCRECLDRLRSPHNK